MKDSSSNDHRTSYYILDREYFSECFDQSADTTTGFNSYRLAIALATISCALFMLEMETYIAWFLLCLSGVELLSIRYKRAWWITRQMLSRAAGSKVDIRIDDDGIFTKSPHHQQSMNWSDITEIKCTERGFVICHDSGNRYLSKNGLGAVAVNLLTEKYKGLDSDKG